MNQRFPKLTVTNFEPIGKAEVTLRPLTVFIGPNNTGKSYLAILIYAIHSYFSGYKSRFSVRPHTEFDSLLPSLSSDEVRDLNDSLKRMDNRIGEICSGESRISKQTSPKKCHCGLTMVLLSIAEYHNGGHRHNLCPILRAKKLRNKESVFCI